MLTAISLMAGLVLDLFFGDPQGFPHPVILIGRVISVSEHAFRRIFPKNKAGERACGVCVWLLTSSLSFAVPFLILYLCRREGPLLYTTVQSFMVYQILAVKSLRDESMKVKRFAERGEVENTRKAVSMIVGRDTRYLDRPGMIRATVETVAENTADGVAAPVFYILIGGAPLGFLYKAVNTMDSMLGYTDPPYTHVGWFPAKMDDILNFLPSRICAALMLLSGAMLHMDFRRGVRIFKRDRFNHASPNSAQTESAAAGLLGLRLAGDAVYHGVLHKKPFIGDGIRAIEAEDITRANRLMTLTALLCVLFAVFLRIGAVMIMKGELWLSI